MNTVTPQKLSDTDFTRLQGQYQAQFGITMNKQVLLLFEAQKTAHLQELELIQNLYQQQRQENAAQYQKQIEVLNHKINQDKLQHEKYTDAIKKAVVAISNQKGAIITENPEVVIKHNLSKYGIICSLILLLGILIAFMYDHYQNRQEEYKKITNALNDYPNIYKFQILAQQGNIKSNPDGRVGEFLVLTAPAKGEGTQAGKNYIYDPENEKVLVPLHFSKKPL